MELVAFLGKDKESWGQVQALINRMECDKIFIIRDKEVTETPSLNEKVKIVDVNLSKGLLELKEEILLKMKKELSGDFEVALSIASGAGKEHMAIISALLSIPVGIRLVAFTKEGIKYIN